MRKNFGPGSLVYPQVVFIIASYDENGKANAMNAAWGGIAGARKIFMCIGSHQSTENILARGAFTVSMGTEGKMAACDYVGVVSAKAEPDKMEKAGFHTVKSEFVDAPVIEELPLTLECRLLSYDPETHYMFGEVVNVSADESIIGEDGKIDTAKLRPILYEGVHKVYHAVGEKLGDAFSVGNTLK